LNRNRARLLLHVVEHLVEHVDALALVVDLRIVLGVRRGPTPSLR
jgi:hypothetical protein